MRHAFLLLLVASLSNISCPSVGAMKKAYLTTRTIERRCGDSRKADPVFLKILAEALPNTHIDYTR